jgi:hypothetical protein
MTTQLKAIETIYRGYRFRSRLEARWAVFFDVLNIQWEYEKEGYELDGVRYLPDFWLPRQQMWVEVKGYWPTPEDLKKFKRLFYASRHTTVMAFDIPTVTTEYDWPRYPRLLGGAEPAPMPALWRWQDMSGGDGDIVPVYDTFSFWTCCPICGYLDVSHCGNNDTLRCGCMPTNGELAAKYEAARWNELTPCILAAYDAARAARFEHGESGASK